jgi:hypothetical protein
LGVFPDIPLTNLIIGRREIKFGKSVLGRKISIAKISKIHRKNGQVAFCVLGPLKKFIHDNSEFLGEMQAVWVLCVRVAIGFLSDLVIS